MKNLILKDENDIYIYFESIKQLEPKRILDVGMFLKRVGSVSRKIMNLEVPKETELDGVDLFKEISFPVWDCVYDNRVDYEEFCQKGIQKQYDLLIALRLEDVERGFVLEQLAGQGRERVRYALFDEILKTEQKLLENAKIIDLNIENNCYYLLDFREE